MTDITISLMIPGGILDPDISLDGIKNTISEQLSALKEKTDFDYNGPIPAPLPKGKSGIPELIEWIGKLLEEIGPSEIALLVRVVRGISVGASKLRSKKKDKGQNNGENKTRVLFKIGNLKITLPASNEEIDEFSKELEAFSPDEE